MVTSMGSKKRLTGEKFTGSPDGRVMGSVLLLGPTDTLEKKNERVWASN